MVIPSFKTGTGINFIGTCDAEITGETNEFDYGQRVYALYRHGACVQLSSGNFKLYRDGVLKHTFNFPSYWGYTYVYYYDWSPGNYKVVCTIGSVVMTRYFTIKKVLKDTKLKCYNKETDVNKKVTLEAKLEEKAFPYYDIENGYVKFYMNGAYQGADYTDADGKAYLDITPTASGTYTIKAVFESAGDYNGSEDTCTLTVNPKKDTKLKCYDKETNAGEKVTLEAKLEEKAFPYYDIENGYVKFYTAISLIGGDYTDANGKAYVDYTPPTAGAFTITAVFSESEHYNGSQDTCTLTVVSVKKDTKLKCYNKETDVNKKVTLEAKLEEKAFPYNDIKNGLIKFYIDDAYVDSGITDGDGKAYVDYTPLTAGMFTIKAVFEPAGEYNGSECTAALTVNPLPECEYTGHAINAKIDHWNVPDNATEGETVTGWVKVDGDCYTPGQTTRGRVKFMVNGGTPTYSTIFTFDCFGETDEMPFSFVMPNYDITLTAEVERCNENGEWENAGPKYKKEFPITLRIEECEYTGHAINAKIDHWNVPDNATEGETITGWVKVDGDCYTPGQTTRGRVKFTLNGGTPEYSTVFTFDCFGETGEMPFTFIMPEYDVTLIVEIERCNKNGEWENAGPKYKKEYTITLVEHEEAFGRIDREKTTPPYSAEEGDEIRISTVIKNIGGTKGEFQMYLFDDTTNKEIEKEPCPRPLPCYWKDLNPDEEYSETLDTDWWWGAMPDHDWKLRIEVRKQTTPDVADDTYPFTVHLGGKAGHVIKLDKIPDTLFIGEEYTFTGNLTKEGEPVSDATVRIMDKDLLFGDFIAEGKTGADGRFAIAWTVEKIEKVAEIYAYHPDSDAKSSIQKVKIEEKIKIPTKLIVYSITTIGCYTAGSLMPEEIVGKKIKALGTALKVVSIIPAALTAVEGYKLIKEKIPAWLK